MSNTDIAEKRKDLARFAEAAGPREIAEAGPRQGDVSAFSEGNRNLGSVPVGRERDIAKIFRSLAELAKAAGPDWFYRYPVNDKGTKKFIEGPSIKLANAVLLAYGNADVDTRVIDLGDSWMIHARFWDLETGASLTRPLLQNKNASRLGGDDENRRINIALSIGVSKATRNVIVNLLGTYCDFAFEEAQNSIVERIGKDLPKFRDRAATGLAERGIAATRAERVIGRAIKDMLAPDLARLSAMLKAIDDGMASATDTFPEVDAAGTEKGDAEDIDKETGEVLGKFAAGEGKPGEKLRGHTAEEAENQAAKNKNPDPSTGPGSGEPAGKGSASPAPTGEASGGGAVDKSGGGAPDAEALATAAKRGADAAKRGVARTIVPAEFQAVAALTDAFLAGYDAEKAKGKSS